LSQARGNAPTQDDFLGEICRNFREGKCAGGAASGCLSCVGKASAAFNLMMERR
jgi:hypothetical protein